MPDLTKPPVCTHCVLPASHGYLPPPEANFQVANIVPGQTNNEPKVRRWLKVRLSVDRQLKRHARELKRRIRQTLEAKLARRLMIFCLSS